LAHNTAKGKKRLATKIEPFSLISELNPMPDIVKRHSLDLDKGAYRLWRLSEDEYRRLRQSSLPIKIDSFIILKLVLSERDNPERLTLGKALTCLENLFGKSSEFLDTWKCSFTFPLLLQLNRQTGKFLYLLRIGDFRGMLDFSLHRFLVSGTDDLNIDAYHDPVEHEFSRDEIDRLLCYIYSFLTGMGQTLKPPKPFLKRVESQNLIYGYDGNDFFEDDFNSDTDFNAAINTFEQRFGLLDKGQQIESLRSLVADIIGEPLND
jgi:hypothetical protein